MTIFRSNSRSRLLVLASVAVLAGVSAFALKAIAQDAAVAPSVEPSVAASTPDAAPAPSAEALEAARKYMEVVPVEDEVKAGLEEMLKRVDPTQRVLARSLADKTINFARLREDAAVATAQIFTVEEIKAMTAFFGSPEGQAVRRKMGPYDVAMQDVMTSSLQTFAMKIQENKIRLTQ